MAAPKEIIDLVELFSRNHEKYRSAPYNEEQTRSEFIDPFFQALGWDMANRKGKDEEHKDVIRNLTHKDRTGGNKAPDYTLRIGGVPKFFLEAKKPAIDIKNDPEPAYQLRRYAWSAKLPLSLLTNFDCLALYDTRIRPRQNDKPSVARIRFWDCREHAEKWDEIRGLFNPDEIEKGSLRPLGESAAGRRGTSEVDAEFLSDIEKWREDLAHNIARNNRRLSVEDLNTAVQRTIDRIIFLRMCEDRGIEPYAQLQRLLDNGYIYSDLLKLYERADKRYNSGLFHFEHEKGRGEPDTLTPSLKIENDVLKKIIGGLYYPDCPYEFSVLPVEILGNVYEQFLGKVIRLTASHQARVEEKPEVKKAGGVYYTPKYIVDYIVKNTVGTLCEGKTPKQISELRILDPACGSGSFLLGAYTYLLDYHRDWYVSKMKKEKGKIKTSIVHNPSSKVLYRDKLGQLHLATPEKKRILLNNIYGVDIDQQAVEVTKLSLLLKILEGENASTLEQQRLPLAERALPDLDNNIKCGNSLIGTDYFAEQLIRDPEEMKRVNPFDWKREFPEIFEKSGCGPAALGWVEKSTSRKSQPGAAVPQQKTAKEDGGFDCVIGNPPWGASYSEGELAYLRMKNSKIIVRMIDSFMYFVFQGCNKVKASGRLGMIVPDVLLYQGDNEKLREFLLDGYRLKSVVNAGNVFDRVTRPACIFVLERGRNGRNRVEIADLSKVSKTEKATAIVDARLYGAVRQKILKDFPGKLFVSANPKHYAIWSRIQNVPHYTLADVVDNDAIQRGVSPDLKEAFIVDSSTAKNWRMEKPWLRPVLTGGKQVKRYYITYPDLWLIYTKPTDDYDAIPNICAYIDQFKKQITCKEVSQKKHSRYSLHRARNENIFLKPEKIVGVITEDEIVVTLDDKRTFVTDGLYLFGVKDNVNARSVVGLLNSRLFVFLYRLLSLEQDRVLAQVKPTILEKLPICKIDLSRPRDKARHDRMVNLVERMLELKRQERKAKGEQERTVIQRQIDSTDRDIDGLVYELYGLTDKEISVVEGK